MIEYRGIKINERIKLYMKNGEYNQRIKKALDDFADTLENNNHALISEYQGNNFKVLIDYKCGHEPSLNRVADYKNGHGCRKCSGHCPEEAKKRFFETIKEEGYQVLGEYEDTTKRIKVRCKREHETTVQPSGFVHQGERCRKCAYIENTIKQSGENDFIKFVEQNGHKILSEYINANTKILIDYQCGHDAHWIKPSVYKKHQDCSICIGLSTPENAERDFYKMLRTNKHKLLSKYKYNNEKVLIDFKCGHDAHWITPKHYKKGVGCPSCTESKGQRIICDWLESNRIPYKAEYKLPNKRYLYDIFIPSYNLIVEVHGVQHYKDVPFFNNRTLKEEQENDRNKKDHAESLGYNYIVVDYREHKPRLALRRFLDQFRHYNPNRRNKSRQGRRYEQLSLF